MDKRELRDYLDIEKMNNFNFSKLSQLKLILSSDNVWKKWRFIKFIRKEQYFHCKNGLFNKFIYFFYKSCRNRLGRQLGYEMIGENFGIGLIIFHSGSIVINENVRVGSNCILHGDVCIGNDGISEECPIIGDNVDIGFGAKIVGNVKIANQIKIGAGAVVTKSFLKEGDTIVGVPARSIGSK